MIPLLEEYVESIRVGESCECKLSNCTFSAADETCDIAIKAASSISPRQAEIAVYAYIAAAEDDVDEMELEGDEQGQDEVNAATVLELPNAALEGVWER